MNLRTWILVAGTISLLPLQVRAAADITLSEVRLTGGYVVSTTPTAVTIKTTHTQAVAAAASIIYTFDTALFVGSQTPSCSGSGTATFTCSTNAGGTILTAQVATNSVGAAETLTLSITTQTAALGSSAATVQVTALTSNAGADTLNGGATDVFRIIAAPTITLTSANLNAGTTPTSVQVQFNSPFDFGSGDTVGITFSKSVLVSSQSTGLTATGITFSSYSTSSATAFSATASASVSLNDAISLTLASPLMAALPNSAGAVTTTLSIDSNNAFSAATGFGTIAASGGGGVGADPVASLGNIRRAFELPLYTLTPLITAPDLVIYGSVFPGNETEQWFDRVVFTTPDESRWMEVRVKKDLEHVNASKLPDWVLSNFDVTLGYGSISNPVTSTKVHILDTRIPFDFLGQEIVFRKMHRHSNIRFPVAGGLRRECVDMAGTSMHLFLCSAPAHEYYGILHHLSLRYMHLDFGFIEVMDYQELTGLIPELWGVHPMTETTKAYVKEVHEETKQMPDGQFKQVGGEHSTAWAGSDGMESVRSGCLEENQTQENLTMWIDDRGTETVSSSCLEQNDIHLTVTV